MKESIRKKINGRQPWIDSAVEEEKGGRRVTIGVEFVITPLYPGSYLSDQLPDMHLLLRT